MLEFLAAGIFIALLLAVFFLLRKLSQYERMLSDVLYAKQSQSVKYGKMSEQWMPFVKNFPYSSEEFRFIGSPIDGIVFSEDSIVFCEFKSGNSQLSEKQKKLKKLVEGKKIEWLEMNIREN